MKDLNFDSAERHCVEASKMAYHQALMQEQSQVEFERMQYELLDYSISEALLQAQAFRPQAC